MKDYSKLFERTKLGRLEVKNRIGMSAMNTHFNEGDDEFNMTAWASKFYEDRAKGGVGLIISGHIKAENTIDPYPVHQGFPVLDTDKRIKEFAEMTDAVHRYGAKILPELSAGTGRNADDFLKGNEPVSASAVPMAYTPDQSTRALTVEEIHQLAEAYGEAALRCKIAGFDGILIHAQSQLIDQFLSEVWNLRTDEYGGSLENRMRFFGECYEAAKKRVGDDFPMMVALSIEHGFEGGRTIDQTIELCKAMEEKYVIDGFYIGDGSYDAMSTMNAHYPEKVTSDKVVRLAEAIKTPIMVVGRYNNPDDALEAVEQGMAVPTLGRALVGDAEWANKVRTNRVNEIRPCMRCMECMDRLIVHHRFVGCAINPALGHERDGEVHLARWKKKVLVIGGGPAGMQAALTADERGHDVTLIEKRGELGGRLVEASVPDYKYRIGDYSEWMVGEVGRSDVKVQLNTEANAELIDALKPDAVVIACGGEAIIPPVKGSELGVTSEAIFRGEVEAGENIVVVGGGLVGSEVAYHLAKQGKKVSIVEMRSEILLDDSVMNKFDLMGDLARLEVDVRVNTKLEEVKKDSVIVNQNGEMVTIEADQVIFAVGFRSNKAMHDQLIMKVNEVYEAGDANKVSKIYSATNSGYMIGRSI